MQGHTQCAHAKREWATIGQANMEEVALSHTKHTRHQCVGNYARVAHWLKPSEYSAPIGQLL
eukprot:3151430-Alexandrium_andersonii.AAC.1